MIKWPDLKFPPVNLYSVPVQYPKYYIELETGYIRLNRTTNYLELQKEFNSLWNNRAKGG